jgi:hypothetical protein
MYHGYLKPKTIKMSPLDVPTNNWIWQVNIVGAIHCLILVGFCIYKRGPMWLLLPGVILSGYLLVLRSDAKKRLETQRDLLSHFRRECANQLGLKRMLDIGPEDWEKYQGYLIGPRAFILLGFNVLISLILEGRFGVALSLVPSIIYMIGAERTRSYDFIKVTVCLNTANQFLSGLIWAEQFTEHAARRAIATRLVCTLGSLEKVEDLFFHVVIVMTILFATVFGPQSYTCLLPIRYFGFVVVPSELLGLRYVLAKLVNSYPIALSQKTYQLAIVACSIPMSLMYLSYNIGEAVRLSFHTAWVLINAVLAIVCYFKQEFLMILVQEASYSRDASPIHGESNEGWYVQITLTLLILSCLMHGLFLEASMISVISLTYIHCITTNEKYRCRAMLVLQSLLCFDARVQASESATVMLASTRVILCFQNRAYGELAWETFAVNAIQILMAPPAAQGSVVFICCYCSIVVLVVAIMRESALRLILTMKRANSFLDHALKQKFSSVGAAIGHVLESYTNGFGHLARLALVRALQECRLGQNSCYLSSFTLQHHAGRRNLSNKNIDDLVRNLNWLKAHGELPIDFIINTTHAAIEVNTDWDLLKSLLIDVSKDWVAEDAMKELRIEVLENLNICDISIRLNHQPPSLSKHRRNHSFNSGIKSNFTQQIRKTVCSELGAEYLDDGRVRIPFISALEVSANLQGAAPLGSANCESRDLFPAGLTIAAIDDSLLVRKSLAHIFKKYLNASGTDSFISGSTRQEALFFSKDVVEHNVDIAIFDENLEFEGEVIRGTDLAADARRNGFTKCAILHSADQGLAQINNSIFDGFIEKTVSKQRFVEEIARVWNDYRRRSIVSELSEQ